MIYTIRIAMDNSVFDDDKELPDILRKLAKSLKGRTIHVGDYIKLFDANGNGVGYALAQE